MSAPAPTRSSIAAWADATGRGGEPGLRSPQGGTEFGGEFLDRVRVAPEPVSEHPVEAPSRGGPVGVFVSERGVEAGRRVELGEVREVDSVGGRVVAGDVPALYDVSADRREVAVRDINPFAGAEFYPANMRLARWREPSRWGASRQSPSLRIRRGAPGRRGAATPGTSPTSTTGTRARTRRAPSPTRSTRDWGHVNLTGQDEEADTQP